MAITLSQLKPGTRIRVRGGFGNHSAITAVVTDTHEDIKNGFPGIDYHPESDPSDSRWAYLDQIDQVLP